MKTYYTVLVRDSDQEPWQIHFGDYQRHVANQEREDIVANGDYLKKNSRIIATPDDQVSIDLAVTNINAARQRALHPDVPFDPPYKLRLDKTALRKRGITFCKKCGRQNSAWAIDRRYRVCECKPH